ncbi:MAG: hypothetical protein QM762_18555 [Chryseolinea sp.]
MRSNEGYHYFFKYALAGFAVLIASFSITSWFDPESITMNGEPGTRDLVLTVVTSLVSVLFFLFFLLIKDKFAIVELSNQSIKIEHLGEEDVIPWRDIEYVKLIQFVSPPLYRLKVKSWDETIWFNTQPHYFEFNGFVSDQSDMADLIKKKKRELGI